MALIVSNYTNYVGPSSTSTLKTGPGKVHALIVTTTGLTSVTVTIYDNIGASGNILYRFQVNAYQPFVLVLPPHIPLRFYTGLTVVTPADTYVFVITEESGQSGSPFTPDTDPYHCRVYNNADISLPNGVLTSLTFNSEYHDSGNMHSTSSNTDRITIPVAGFYAYGGCIAFDSNATGVRSLAVRNNALSAYIVYHSVPANLAGYRTILSVSGGHYFAASDYIQLLAYQTSGASLDVKYVSAYSPVFWAAKIY